MIYCMIDNLTYGGAERQAAYLVENNIGFEELILLENYKKYKIKTTIPVYSIYPNILNIYERPIKDNMAVKDLHKKINEKDTIVSFLERSNIINIKTSLKTGHKSIISVRNYLSERYKDKKYLYRKFLIKKYYPLADLIIANSMASKQDLINNFNVPEDKIKVIYNLIDTDNIKHLRQEQLENKYEHIFESPVILNIGSLIPQKAQKQLIEAFKVVKECHTEYKMVIIGTGKLYEYLNKVIKDNNLTNEVYLLGNTNNPFKYLNYSEIFVLNSNFEGFPNVLLEALAVGKPVVTKNCLSGPQEMLEVTDYDNTKGILTKYGYIFPRANKNISESLEKKLLIESLNDIISLRKNNEKEFDILKKNCLVRADDFSIQNILYQWSKIIN